MDTTLQRFLPWSLNTSMDRSIKFKQSHQLDPDGVVCRVGETVPGTAGYARAPHADSDSDATLPPTAPCRRRWLAALAEKPSPTHPRRPAAATLVRICLCVGLCWLPLQQASAEEGYGCLIEPMVVASVGSQVQGVVEELLVDRSDLITRGQPLVLLAADIESTNLEQARARADMASEISAREADLRLAEHQMRRMRELHAQNMAPAAERDEAVAQYEVARATLSQARDNRTLQQLELQRAQQTLAQRTLRSPIDGVVVEQQVAAGEFVYDNPVMTIAQLDPLRVEVVLPASRFGEFEPGDVATVEPEMKPAEPLQAIVDVVDRQLDPRSGTFGIRLLLANPDLLITSGQQCKLQFSGPGAELVCCADSNL